MRPIALARVRLNGVGHNICGVSATVFVASAVAVRGEQTHGVVDHITLIDDGVVLFEREGFTPELMPLQAVATMVPVENLSGERLGAEYLAERAKQAEERQAKAAVEAAKRNAEIVAFNTDAAAVLAQREAGEDLTVAPSPVTTEPEVPAWKRLGRSKPGPKPKSERPE